MNRFTSITIAGVIAAGLCSAAGTAHAAGSSGTAGTIVYIKNHNVWIARGTGNGTHAVTTDGTKRKPYGSPSESDSGVIAAAHGNDIVRMTQRGKVLNTIDPPALRNSAGETLDGAVNDVAISPNGTRIAWSYVRYSCPVGVECMVRFATGYTAATHKARKGKPTFFRAPAWVGNSRTLQTGGFGSQVMLQDIGHAPKHWFDDSDYAASPTDLSDGELSRDGKWLAEIRGYGADSAVIWYRVSGNAKTGAPPAVPAYLCLTNGEAKHASPTWSPDSTALAWAGSDGIWIKHKASDCEHAQPKLAIKGGSAPDWSPAALK